MNKKNGTKQISNRHTSNKIPATTPNKHDKKGKDVRKGSEEKEGCKCCSCDEDCEYCYCDEDCDVCCCCNSCFDSLDDFCSSLCVHSLDCFFCFRFCC